MRVSKSLEKAESAPARKKRVLLVIRWPVGGIRTYLRYVYRSFDPSKWQFTIVAPQYDEMKVLLEDLSDLDVDYVSVTGGDTKSFLVQASSLIFKGQFDLIHSHGFTSGVCAALPASLRRTPHLLTSHDVLNEEQFPGARGKFKKQAVARLLNLVDKIQSVSHDAQENLLEHFPSLRRYPEKCVVIPNGIEVERFINAEPRNLRNELGLGDDVFLIGFMGRFMAQKGFRYLVDAMEILKKQGDLPRKPVVLTFGDGRYIRREKEAVKDRGLEDFFVFMPFTANVAGTIKGVDVVAMPSLWEACGLLAMETLACGTPLIGSNCIGLREVLRGTPAKVIPKGDAHNLALALSQEIKTSSITQFQVFQEKAALEFDIKTTCMEIEKLYGRVGG